MDDNCPKEYFKNGKQIWPLHIYAEAGEITEDSAKLLAIHGITDMTTLKSTPFEDIARMLGVDTIYETEVWGAIN